MISSNAAIQERLEMGRAPLFSAISVIRVDDANLSDIELTREDEHVIENVINTNEDRFKSLVNAYRQPRENIYIVVRERNENGKYPLVISARRYLAAQTAGREKVRVGVISDETAAEIKEDLTRLQQMVLDAEHFKKIGDHIKRILERYQMRRDELCDMTGLNMINISRYTSYHYRSTPLERAFVDEGWIDSPNNYERLRSLPRPAQEALLEYARKIKRTITRTEIDRAKEEGGFEDIENAPTPLRQRQRSNFDFSGENAKQPDFDEMEEALDMAFSPEIGVQRERTYRRREEKNEQRMFTENEMRLFLAAQGADYRVPDEELEDAFKAAVIAVCESLPEETKRKVRRDNVLNEAEKAAMEGRINPKLILEMIRLMKETS